MTKMSKMTSDTTREPSFGEGAFRSATIQALCVVCSEPAHATGCRRCGAPHCEAHAPRVARRCQRCEQAYDAFLEDRINNPVKGWMLAVSYLLVIGGAVASLLIIQPGEGALVWLVLLPALVALGFLPLWIGLYRRRAVRRLFLAELPDRRPLALPEAPLEPPPPLPPGTNLSWVAMALNFAFVVPFLPQIGALLGVRVLASAKMRAHRANVVRAVLAVLVGATTALFWLALLINFRW